MEQTQRQDQSSGSQILRRQETQRVINTNGVHLMKGGTAAQAAVTPAQKVSHREGWGCPPELLPKATGLHISLPVTGY